VVSVTIVTLLYVALPSDFVNAFDGQRSGFILGGGAGSSFRSRAETVGLQTAFIIGGGVSDQVTISYTGLQFWGKSTSSEVGFALLPSAEVRYYLSPNSPSAFGGFGFGLAVYDNDTGEWGIGAGFAPHLGVGYEFARHYSAELEVVHTLDTEGEHKPLLNIMLIVTAIAY
jgi:hypothetical protein